MANDTPSTTTTPLLRPSRRWFSSLRLKTTLSAELGGSVGDLGTYIPIVLALTLVNHLDLSTTLIFTALYNISTGFLFGIPMPVQPMKSIAAVAISDPLLSLPQIAAAGLSTAATLFILGATGLMSLLYRFIPLPVVRGVQLSQGLAFASPPSNTSVTTRTFPPENPVRLEIGSARRNRTCPFRYSVLGLGHWLW
ncbi:Molybdate transporter 2 [Vitis vinifera]|uniref:Molybdate transporter 2 n=1 Tax=Vitis vinifera TaxID=29760 RepID=A0A438GY60_VITVI|nr:Molybdate transporter 2 [Vitis vinifera]